MAQDKLRVAVFTWQSSLDTGINKHPPSPGGRELEGGGDKIKDQKLKTKVADKW